MYAVVLIVTLFVLWLTLIVRHLTYWKRHGVPQYSVFKILQKDFNLITKKESTAEMFSDYCNTFSNKRYFGITPLFQNSLVVQDPDLIKQITTTDFGFFQNHGLACKTNEPLWDKNVFALRGNEWKKMRQILQPICKPSIVEVFSQLQICANQVVAHFEKRSQNESCVTAEMRDVFTRFSTDVIASFAFGYSCDSLQNPNNDFFVNSHAVLPSDGFFNNLKTFLIFNVPDVARLLSVKFFSQKGSSFFSKIVSRNMKDREENGIVRRDIIHALMEARKIDKNITDVDVTAQALIFYFAGVETVSSWLSFTTYELAVHSDIQKRLQDEVDKTLKRCEHNISYHELRKMKYLNMVLLEALRKWNTAVATDRVCTKPYVIEPKLPGEKPVHLNKGDVVCLPLYGIHRNPNIFENPDTFDPERFNDDQMLITKNKFFPFGNGPRQCVANLLVQAEAKLVICLILSKFDIVPVDKTVIPLRLAKITKPLSSENGFWLGLKKRIVQDH